MSCQRGSFLASLVLLGLLALACGPARRPDVILVTIDALRADRVFGAEAARIAPHLQRLARAGVSFHRAYAASSWTVPSMVSLLTATYPSRHAVEHGSFSREGISGQELIPQELILLPERLRALGYRTFGITANPHLMAEFGFSRGFDRYAGLGFADAQEVLDRLAEWEEEIAASRPFFLWLHFLDPHTPYRRQSSWFYASLPPAPTYPELEGRAPASIYAKLGVARGSTELAYIEALYESEISRLDAAIGDALARLDARAEALVVVASDHGEEFLEHGHFGHGENLFGETLRVPLIVRLPGRQRAATVVDLPVSLVDLAPTVLQLLGTSPLAESQGRGLLPPGQELPQKAVFAELDRFSRSRAVVDGDWMLVDELEPEASRSLLRQTADPEGAPEPVVNPARVDALLQLLEAHEQSSRRGRPARVLRGALRQDVLQQLRALGYDRP